MIFDRMYWIFDRIYWILDRMAGFFRMNRMNIIYCKIHKNPNNHPVNHS